jgi:hypothetical protein
MPTELNVNSPGATGLIAKSEPTGPIDLSGWSDQSGRSGLIAWSAPNAWIGQIAWSDRNARDGPRRIGLTRTRRPPHVPVQTRRLARGSRQEGLTPTALCRPRQISLRKRRRALARRKLSPAG